MERDSEPMNLSVFSLFGPSVQLRPSVTGPESGVGVSGFGPPSDLDWGGGGWQNSEVPCTGVWKVDSVGV